LVRIKESIGRGEFASLPPLAALASHVCATGGTLHIMGLLGSGGVHAIDQHLLATIRAFVAHDVPRIAIHGFLDGRDSAPTGAAEVVAQLERDVASIGGGRTVLATLI